MTDNHKNAAFWADGVSSGVVDFNFDAVDIGGAVEEFEDDPKILAGIALSRILVWVWSGRNGFKNARNRLIALTAGIRPDLLQNKTYEELGVEMNITADAVCKLVKLAQATFGLKFGRTKGKVRRAAMARAQRVRRARERLTK